MTKRFSFLIILAVIVLIVPSFASASENSTIISDDGTADGADLEIDVGGIESHGKKTTDARVYVTVKNNGPDVAYNTTVQSEIPKEIKYLGYESTVGSYSHESGIWKVGDLKANGMEKLSLHLQTNNKNDMSLLEFEAKSDTNDSYTSNNNGVYALGSNTATQMGPEVRKPAYVSSVNNDFRGSEQRSLYDPSYYNDYRSITKSIDNRAEAKMNNTTVELNKSDTANPILLALLSMTALIGIIRRR